MSNARSMVPRGSTTLAIAAIAAIASCSSPGARESADPAEQQLGPAAGDPRAGADAACTTRVTYGAAWIRGADHPAPFDVVPSDVTWDGACTNDGASSFAVLSNGWKPYFQGHDACVIALDHTGACAGAPAGCTTRVTYGSAWIHGASHPSAFDDVTGRVSSDGLCHDSGAQSYADLSNGWRPFFSGNGACGLSFEHQECGGLYANPIIPTDCPDPGVLRDGTQYVLACTSGNAADAFPIYTSPDLVTWTRRGNVFPSASRPSWAQRDFWAPEIHRVGGRYVAYFSARGADGQLAVGAASAASALGPFTDIGAPLVHDPSVGLIDASEITAPDGTPYVLWKEDGNAAGRKTPIHAQPLAADGLSRAGQSATLITNDLAWEGGVVEAPFMVERGGTYFLFYSGNGYATDKYAVGVARASSPLGPFTKAGAPILVTGGAWAGPGHASVVDTAAGDTFIVYHAWKNGAIGAAPGRLVLGDLVAWGSTWPAVPLAPSSTTRPTP